MRLALATLTLAWAALATLFTLVALVRLHRARRAHFPAHASPPVLLLRPLDAPTARELANLAAPIDYPGPLEQIVLSPTRPLLPDHVRWLASDPSAHNRKVGHLLHALANVPHADRVVIALDADVCADAALLCALARPIADGAALATAAPLPAPGRSLAWRAQRALLANTHHSFVALHAMSAGAPAVCGKALAFGPEALAELPMLADHVGEDLELASRLHACRLTITLASAPASLPTPDAIALATVLDRFTRWMQVLRAHRPALYPTVPILFAPALTLAALALALRSPVVALAVSTLWLARTLLALRLAPRSAIEWPLGEALLLAAFARSLTRRHLLWRGRAFVLRHGGRMEPALVPPR